MRRIAGGVRWPCGRGRHGARPESHNLSTDRHNGEEKTTYSLGRVEHGLSPRLTLIARGANDLRATELVLTRLRALVAHAGAAEHLVERELLDHLRPCVGGCLERLNVLLAVALVVEDLHVMLPDERVEVLLRLCDILARLAVEREREFLRGLECRASRSRRKVDLAGGEGGEDELVQAERGRAIHAGVLAEETGFAVLVNDDCNSTLVS